MKYWIYQILDKLLANLFTTNYDLFLEKASDEVLQSYGFIFNHKLDESLFIAKDDAQFEECTRQLKAAINKGEIPRDIFTPPKKLVPFAFDPAGNLICFDYKNDKNNPVVVFWEHENAGEKEMLMRQESLTEAQPE